MPVAPLGRSSAVGEAIATAVGRRHRADPVTPGSGGPAGNASLTAWVGLVLLVLFVVESVTLISMSRLLVVHIFVGAFIVPIVILKTATTGWRMMRYYSRSPDYVRSGPPPTLLRVLAPLVVLGAFAVLGTGLALVGLGSSAHDQLFRFLGFGVDAVTLHQAAFVLWVSTTGLHLLGRFVPALQVSRLAPSSAPRTHVPGVQSRVALTGLTCAAATVTGLVVVNLSGAWVG